LSPPPIPGHLVGVFYFRHFLNLYPQSSFFYSCSIGLWSMIVIINANLAIVPSQIIPVIILFEIGLGLGSVLKFQSYQSIFAKPSPRELNLPLTDLTLIFQSRT
jgi:hypothetical protein